MNRNQRRLGRAHQKQRFDEKRSANAQLEEVLPPRNKRDQLHIQKLMTNKCCFTVPLQKDVAQSTEVGVVTDKYQNVLKEQFGLDRLNQETMQQLKELRKLLCNNTTKVETSSQCAEKEQRNDCLTDDGTQWQTIESAAEIDKYITMDKEKYKSCVFLPENVRIAETPRIKIIAKKFSKCKKNNIELRKLDEKVVCVEYDVFIGDQAKPKEKLRAFFSIKPSYGKKGNDEVLKEKFNITDEQLKKLNEKEIEIIDGKLEENRSYLDDLKRILRRKQAIYAKKNKDTLDLMSLYEMAKRACPPLDDGFSNANFLSKAELQEIKDLIMKKCASSVHGVYRRTLKKDLATASAHLGVISQSIVAELWREGETLAD